MYLENGLKNSILVYIEKDRIEVFRKIFEVITYNDPSR